MPRHRSSAGREAVELAASVGLILDDWQADVLDGALAEREDGKWAAFEVACIVPRQNGKGAILEARELAGLFLFDERLILHSAQELKTSLEAFRRVKALIDGSDELRRMVSRVDNTNGSEAIELRSGARLRFVSRSKNSGRGFSGDCVILDEAYALTALEIEALLPTMSARPNPQIWYTSSPSLDATSGALLMNVRARGESAAPGLAYFDFGCVAGADLDDRENWFTANPAMPHRISEEFVERERAAMSAEGFGRERLGIWPESAGDSVITPDQWSALANRDVARPTDVAFAIDVAPDRQHASIMLAAILPDGRHLVEVAESRRGTDWILERVVGLRERWDPLLWVVDALSPAATLIPQLAALGVTEIDREHPQRGQLVVMNTREAAAAWGLFVDRGRQGQLVHLADPILTVALAGAKTRPLGDGSAWARRSGGDITPLVGATEASWAVSIFAEALTTPADPSAHWL